MSVKRKWDKSSDEQRRKCVDEIISRIDDIQDDAGIIAAEEIIEIVLENLAPDIHNSAIKETKKIIQNKLEDTITEIELLEN